MKNTSVSALLDLNHTIARALFEGKEHPWEVLPGLSDWIRAKGAALPADEYDQFGEDVWIAKDADVAPTAYLNGPLIVDHGAEIRHCAFVRGSAVVGKNAVVGNSVELKNCVLFDERAGSPLQLCGRLGAGPCARTWARARSRPTCAATNRTSSSTHSGDLPTGLQQAGRDARRPRRGGLQQRAEPGHGAGAGLHRLPHLLRARRDSREKHISKTAARSSPRERGGCNNGTDCLEPTACAAWPMKS